MVEEHKISSLAYPSNSDVSKKKKEEAAKPEIKAVVKSNATVKKPSPFKRLFGKIFADDWQDIKTSIVSDTILPAIRGAIYDMGTGMLESMFGISVSRSKSYSSRYGHTNYSSISSSRSRIERLEKERDRTPMQKSMNADRIVFETRDDALAVLDGIMDIMNDYEMVSVADVYSLAGLPSEFTDNRFGWVDIQANDVSIIRVGGGWELRLPKPYSLDQWL